MTEKRKVLGRGLETLLPRHLPHAPATGAGAAGWNDPTLAQQKGERGAPAWMGHPTGAPGGAPAANDVVHQIAIGQLDRNPYQTRSTMDEVALNELAASIRTLGVLQPITVRPVTGGRYQVMAGERRWLASRIAGKETVPCIVRQVSNEQAMVMTVIENLQREDLNPMEEARAYERLGREFGLTQEQMSQRTGKERSSIANFLRLLKLPAVVQTMIEAGELSFGHGKVLMALETPEAMEKLAKRAQELGLSVRQVEEEVTKASLPRPMTAQKERVVDPNVREAERQLEEALGARVVINDRKGKGKIIIEYWSLDEFDRIVEAMGKASG